MARPKAFRLLYPFEDPEFDPNHPIHSFQPTSFDPFITTKSQRRLKQEDEERLKGLLAVYSGKHEPRIWEIDESVSLHRLNLLDRILPPKDRSYTDEDERWKSSEYSQALIYFTKLPEDQNFRTYCYFFLQHGYNRIHASYGDPPFSEEPPIPEIPPDDICWISEYTLMEIAAIRRRLAIALGEELAVTVEGSELYDDEIEWRYTRRVHARCRRKNKFCIRPSHITLFTASDRVIP